MKWIIYALLLANLAFGLWHYRSTQLASNNPQSQETDNLRLVLVKEFLAEQSQPATSDNNSSCYTLGPFKSVKDANSVRDQLKAAGVTTKRRMSKDTSRQGFWVFLPAANKHAHSHAHEIIDQLKAKGITDYFLVATGDHTNAVSLGVFSQSDTAQRRITQIKGMGFQPEVEKVDLPRREYWLDWTVDQTLSTDVLNKIRKQYKGIGQTERSCSISG